MEIIILILVGLFCFVILADLLTSNRKKKMAAKLKTLQDFKSTQEIMGNDGKTGLAIDEKRKKVCLIDFHSGQPKLYVLKHRDLLAAEVVENGNTVTKTSRGSQLGGALIGGLAFGGVGAIIGGLSGSRSSQGKVSRVDLRLTVNRMANPIHEINFMNLEGKKDGIIHTAAMKSARHCLGVIDILIKQADREDTAETQMTRNTSQYAGISVADEIEKLMALRNRGVLNEDEFSAQKRKLLSR